jgi:hypothetical protein
MKTLSSIALAGLCGLLVAGCNIDRGEQTSFGSLEPSKMGPPPITGPSLEQYVSQQGPATRTVAQGKMKLDGHPVHCGKRPTVIDAKLDSWGGSFPGYLILNPDRLKGLATPVKFYVYYHECGHEFVGASEVGADCFSIQRGVGTGWLDAKGMDQICAFISQLKGDAVHPPGPRRCQLMRRCYAAALEKKAQFRSAKNAH